MKPTFICFTGIDGSGKSTLAQELVKLLNSKGIQCKYVYARQNPFILKPFISIGRLVFLHGESQFINYSRYSVTKGKAIQNHFLLSRIYEKIFWLDCLPQLLSRVKLPLALHKDVVCDRYLYDTVITDLSVDMNYSTDRTVGLINKLLHLLPKPDITFLVDIPEEIAFQRKDDIPSIEYLRERRQIYLEVGKLQGMYILDGTKKVADLRCEIETVLFQRAQH